MANLILMSVTHSGGSVVAKMLHELGWRVTERTGTAKTYLIYREVLRKNNNIIRDTAHVEPDWLFKFSRTLPEPWMLRDDRFCVTLDYWSDAFPEKPVLIWLTRDLERVSESFVKRNQYQTINGQRVPGWFGRSVQQLHECAAEQFRKWEGAKLKVDYGDIAYAVKLFDVARGCISHPRSGLDGWR